MSHHSMVLAPFNNTDSGAIGVIGPTRMDYQNVYGLLSYASKLVSNKQENMEKSQRFLWRIDSLIAVT